VNFNLTFEWIWLYCAQLKTYAVFKSFRFIALTQRLLAKYGSSNLLDESHLIYLLLVSGYARALVKSIYMKSFIVIHTAFAYYVEYLFS